ncbi:MAG: IclR family transcriptional regulator [Rhizobiaceae bacterium]|nr:IclR family transcriptional regulator [Rhizobiaceae bacterium]MBL4732082.1 IclR family transcriptional regulator [Rhizobiaceae bacterium]
MRKRTPETKVEAAKTNTENDRQFVTALHRGLEILRAFKPTDRAGLGNRELAERTGLPNSTVSRLTFTLWKLGYIVYDDGTGRYRMGVPVLSLGYACLAGMQIRETAQVYMQELADECGDGVLVALGSRDNMTMTYLACARSVGLISLQLSVGSRISLSRSALGRAYIAGTTQDERDEILISIEERGDADFAQLMKGAIVEAQDQIGAKGFYMNIGGWQPDVNSVAVPYRSPDGNIPMMSFNLGGPAYNLPKEKLELEFGPKLVEMVNKIGRVS